MRKHLFESWNGRQTDGSEAQKSALFEVVPAMRHPEDYEETHAQSSRITGSGNHPPLARLVSDVARHGSGCGQQAGKDSLHRLHGATRAQDRGD